MKKVLAILVVIVFVASLSSAASYQPTKDTFYRYDTNLDGQGSGNDCYGGATQNRAGKGWQDGFYMDFDRATIVADITAALGRAPVAADFTSGAVVVTLSEMSSADWGTFTHTAMYTPAYFTSTTPWSESGSSFNMSDRPSSTMWNNSGDWHNALSRTQGTAQMWSAPDYTYQVFNVDANVASGYLLTGAVSAGIMVMGNDYSNNGTCYSREATSRGLYAGPVLTVTVPEPMTLSLLAAGALALIRRRK
jgi:hypothetical protein